MVVDGKYILYIYSYDIYLHFNYRDQNDKKAALTVLRKKALNKNPDEFHYHMINSKIKVQWKTMKSVLSLLTLK